LWLGIPLVLEVAVGESLAPRPRTRPARGAAMPKDKDLARFKVAALQTVGLEECGRCHRHQSDH
jgi:hypothetical protein